MRREGKRRIGAVVFGFAIVLCGPTMGRAQTTTQTLSGTFITDVLSGTGVRLAQGLITFTPDGSIVEDHNSFNATNAAVGGLITTRTAWRGTWFQTGDRQFAITAIRFNFDTSGNPTGTTRRKDFITMNAAFDAFTGPFSTENFDTSGNLISFAQGGTLSGKRLTVEPTPTGITFSPNPVRVSGSVTATITGASLDSSTFFDIRFRSPGTTVDEVVTNWQQGLSALHAVSAGTTTGTWTVTGLRAHKDPANTAGPFVTISATLSVQP